MQCLVKAPKLAELDLSTLLCDLVGANTFDDKVATVLEEALARNKTLLRLSFCSPYFQCDLYVGGARFTDEHAMGLAKGLAANKTLQYLSLGALDRC